MGISLEAFTSFGVDCASVDISSVHTILLSNTAPLLAEHNKNFMTSSKIQRGLTVAFGLILAAAASSALAAIFISTATVMYDIEAPLSPGQAGVVWSGYVTKTSTGGPDLPPNGRNVYLRASMEGCHIGEGSIALSRLGASDPNAPVLNRSWSGLFNAPTQPGRYWFWAYFPETTQGSFIWESSVSACQEILVGEEEPEECLIEGVVRDTESWATLSGWTVGLMQEVDGPTAEPGIPSGFTEIGSYTTGSDGYFCVGGDTVSNGGDFYVFEEQNQWLWLFDAIRVDSVPLALPVVKFWPSDVPTMVYSGPLTSFPHWVDVYNTQGETQTPAQCTDGADNDNDGFLDMFDPGCIDERDDNESNS